MNRDRRSSDCIATRLWCLGWLVALTTFVGTILGCAQTHQHGHPELHDRQGGGCVESTAKTSDPRVERPPARSFVLPPAPPDPAEPLLPSPPVTTTADRVETDRGSGDPASTPVTDRATVRLADGLVVDRLRNELRFAATVCLREGWLEQLVCTPQTREHEAIFVTSVRPSLVHAGLLLLGLEPGTPGSWRLEGERLIEVEPTGPAIEIFVRFHPAAAPGGEPSAGAKEGETAEIPIAALVMDISTDTQLHGPYWRFAGSELLGDDRPPQIPPYAADWSGSLVGLVTFGDEVLALPNVRPDQVDVAPGEWLAWTERIPPLGTAVTIILRPRSAAAD